jgi:hypothetical protein
LRSKSKPLGEEARGSVGAAAANGSKLSSKQSSIPGASAVRLTLWPGSCQESARTVAVSSPSQAVGRVSQASGGLNLGGPIEHLAQPKSGSASFRQSPRWELWISPQGAPQTFSVKP